jgi:NTP pyrophosphatase (non-canonical NTP hydrolase)
MNRTEHLLTCLAEECAEVAHRVSKALRFGLDDIQPGQELTNAQQIAQEFHDLLAVIEMLEAAGELERPRDMHAIDRKKNKVLAYMEYAEQRGTLTQ